MRLAIILLFLIYYCTARIMLPEKLSYIESIVFFGFEPLEMRRLMSSIEYSFENNRKILGQLMKSIDSSVTMMDHVDKLNDKLKGVHDEFRKQAMSIPILWEENENLLLKLVSTSNIAITYGITASSSSETNTKEVEEKVSQEHSSDRKGKLEKAKSSNTSGKSNGKAKDVNTLLPPSYDSLEQILVHLCRDWSSQGDLIRQRLYIDGIIPRLLENLPIYSAGGVDSNVDGCTDDECSTDHPENLFLAHKLGCDTQSQYADEGSTAADEKGNVIKNRDEDKFYDDRRTKNIPIESLERVRSIERKKNSYAALSERATVCNASKMSPDPAMNPSVTSNQPSDRTSGTHCTVEQPSRNSLGIRVLVPGAGLGRLASEIAARGYAVEANDCSGMFLQNVYIVRILFTNVRYI
jgi:N2227-like protein